MARTCYRQAQATRLKLNDVTAFDWNRLAEHRREILELMIISPWILREPGSPFGDLIHDPFGKTIHASDTKLNVGKVYHIGVSTMDWHAEPIPILARILRECSRSEASQLSGKTLAARAHYYEVLID